VKRGKMDWSYWLNKQVFIQSKKGDCYTGTVIFIDDVFAVVLDKFGERVVLALSEVGKIKEETNQFKQLNPAEEVK
jgi:small nuclear ribonucleoprotein (snRNP)-like protein